MSKLFITDRAYEKMKEHGISMSRLRETFHFGDYMDHKDFGDLKVRYYKSTGEEITIMFRTAKGYKAYTVISVWKRSFKKKW